MTILGVDACKRGWVGVALTLHAVAYFAPTIVDLAAKVSEEHCIEVVAVDIPIGLPLNGRREADELAKKQVGPAAGVRRHGWSPAAAQQDNVGWRGTTPRPLGGSGHHTSR